jgi:hypothetical protein
MSVSKSFTAVGDGPELLVRNQEQFSYDVSGTFVGTVKLEQESHGGWTVVASVTTAASGTVVCEAGNKPHARFRFRCSAFTSGTIVTALTAVTSEVSQVVRDAHGVPVLNISEDGLEVPSDKVLSTTNQKLTTPAGSVYAKEVTFTETAGAGVYTGAVSVPAGATILDIVINAVALWNPATSATLKVGDTDDDGYYTGVDLMATDLLAGESLSFALAGGKAGAYIANSQVSPRYAASARTINGIITVVGASGSTGRTRMTVVYHLPVAADIVAATKV